MLNNLSAASLKNVEASYNGDSNLRIIAPVAIENGPEFNNAEEVMRYLSLDPRAVDKADVVDALNALSSQQGGEAEKLIESDSSLSKLKGVALDSSTFVANLITIFPYAAKLIELIQNT